MKRKLLTVLLAVACALSCVLPLVACGGKNDGVSKHEHVFSNEWQYDETHHWLPCTFWGCEKKKLYRKHIFQDDGYCACGKRDMSIPSEGLRYELSNDGQSYIVTGIGSSIDTGIVIPAKHEGKPVTEISNYAFSGQFDITEIIIPNSVKRIGMQAFAHCASLTQIVIPDSVTEIGEQAFYWCYGLERVTLGKGIRIIRNEAFEDCDSFARIDYTSDIVDWCNIYGLLFITANNRAVYIDGKELAGNVVIPSGAMISDYAFFACDKITSLSIPKSVKHIGNGAFAECTALTRINYEGTKIEWRAIAKLSFWDSFTGNYTVYCSDGTIAKTF